MLAANSPAFKPGMKRDSNNDFPQIISNSPLFRAGKLNKVFILAAVIILTSRAGPILAQERPDKKRMPSLSPHHMHGPDVPRMAPDEVLIKFRENFTLEIQEQFQTQVKVKAANREQAVAAFHAFHRTRARGKALFGWQRVTLPAGKRVMSAMEEYKKNVLVEAVEPNYIAYAADVISTTYTARAWINDPYYSDGQSQWWLDRTNTDEVINRDINYTSPADIIVAVVDTGADLNHSEFSGRLVPGCNFLGSGEPEDDNGHGTHVTGMIVANANNGLGVAGTAYKEKVKVMPIKVLNQYASGLDFDVAAGITWAADNGADIINLSLVIYSSTNPAVLAAACSYAAGQGCFLIAASGNDNVDYDFDPPNNHYYPAGDPNVMAVAATTSENYVTWYSNWGSIIDLAAPGGSFDYYTDHGVTSTAMDDGFSAVQGTSFAASQVSALAALLWLQDSSRSVNTLRTLMTNHCENPGNEQVIVIGAGRINVFNSLGGDAVVTFTPSNTPTSTPTPTITKTLTYTQTFTITPTYTMTPTVTPTPTITVTFTITPTATITPTSTPMILGREEIRVYPQPGRDYVRVAFNFQGQGRVSLDLYTVAGERVIHLEERPQEQAGSAIVEIATKKVSPGVYYLHIQVQDSQGKRQLKAKVAIVK